MKTGLVDIFFATKNYDTLAGQEIIPSSSVLYFRNSINSKSFVKEWTDKIALSSSLTDQDGLRRLLKDVTRVKMLLPDEEIPVVNIEKESK